MPGCFPKRAIHAFHGWLKALTKSTLCQTLKNPARQGSKLAAKGAYIDVSDRRLQVQLTQQAKIPSALLLSEGIFVFAGICQRSEPSMFFMNGSLRNDYIAPQTMRHNNPLSVNKLILINACIRQDGQF